MIKVRLQIGSGNVYDTETQYGFIYLDSDKRVGAPSKGFEATSYPEEEGEHILPNGLKEYYPVTFYNDYKRHKIVGYPTEIAEAQEFWRDKSNQINDVVVVEWTIRVNKPSLCDFNLTTT